MPGNTLASRTMNLNFENLLASNSLRIGLKTISYCQNSDMRIIVNQSLKIFNSCDKLFIKKVVNDPNYS